MLQDPASESSPWPTFNHWFNEARNSSLRDPNAMVVATVDENLQPSTRVVLCKEVRPNGLAFFTNYNSRKGRELAANNKCAINFFWEPLYRQVKMRGSISKTSRKESEDYWNSRARGSQ